MDSGVPQHILCAVRGGPESRETVTYAIDLALQHDARLTFFRAMDAEFLNHATVGPLSVIYRELREVARFAMLILCDRANRRGVTEVDYVVREGDVRAQLRLRAAEACGELLVMGHPTRSPGSNVFKAAELKAFVAELEQAGNLRVIVVTPSQRNNETQSL
jgi:nucleotide-binding universal stress UspA family protein